jgi:arginine exporter protein ArgO
MSLFISSFVLAIAFCAPPGVITAETVRRGAARGFLPALFFWTGLGTTVFASISGRPQPADFAVFFAGFLAGAILWCFFMAGLVAWGRKFVTPAFFRWVNLACGLALGFFALQLGLNLLRNLG